MPVAQEIESFRAALLVVARELGLDPEALWASEDAEGASASARVPPERLENLDPGRLSSWLTALGGALEIRFWLKEEEGGPREMEEVATAASHDKARFVPLFAEARRFGRPVNVKVEVKKEPLEARIRTVAGVPWPADLRTVIFFSGASLAVILSAADYRYFEKVFLGASGPEEPDRLLLVLVADAPGRLAGGFLTVLGNDHLEEAGAFAVSPAAFERLRAARELVGRKSQWTARPWLLTPDFFALDEATSSGLESVKKELVRMRNELSISYLANRTEPLDGTLGATFEGTRSVQIPVLAEPEAPGPYELYRWTYGDPESARTRLEIVRRVVAARLPEGEPGFRLLVREARSFLSEAGVQLRILIDENVVRNFERWQKVEDLARDYSDKAADRIRGLTREVADNVYKTAGLLLGVAVAYLLKPDQGPWILLASVAFYALYILGVVLRFYLPALRQEHDAKRRAFLWSARELRRLRILSAETRGRLRWVLSENRRFNQTFRRVRWLYMGLVVFFVVGAALWVTTKKWPEPPEGERALAEQARRFKALGYEDIRTRPGPPLPVPLTDSAGGILFPDLSAVSKAGRLVVLSYIPCSRMGNPEELRKLLRLHEAAGRQKAETQLLTEAVCGEEPGPRRLGAWLRGRLPDPVVWSP